MTKDGWTLVSSEHPCAICRKTDWCLMGERVWKCMRVASGHPCPSGGWYHPIQGVQDILLRPWNPAFKPKVKEKLCEADFHAIWSDWHASTPSGMLEELASALGVSAASLARIGAAWSERDRAWAFPMRDQNRKMIGIRLRSQSGAKWAVTGSRQGMFLDDVEQKPKTAWVTEGPTDTAAALSIGAYAIGRPSVNCGAEMIRELLRILKIRSVYVIADRDFGPAWTAMQQFRRNLKMPTALWWPHAKDLREAVRQGLTKAEVDRQLEGLTLEEP